MRFFENWDGDLDEARPELTVADVQAMQVERDVEGLAYALCEERRDVKRVAFDAVRRLGPRIVPDVVDFSLGDDDETVMAAACAVYSALGGEAVEPLLDAVVTLGPEAGPDEVVAHADYFFWAMASVGPDAVGPLARFARASGLDGERLADLTPDVRAAGRLWALTTLGQLFDLGVDAPPDVLEPLEDVLVAGMDGLVERSSTGLVGLDVIRAAGQESWTRARLDAFDEVPTHYPEDATLAAEALVILRRIGDRGAWNEAGAYRAFSRLETLLGAIAEQADRHAPNARTAAVVASVLAGFVLFCDAHLRADAATELDRAGLAERVSQVGSLMGNEAPIDRGVVATTLLMLREELRGEGPLGEEAPADISTFEEQGDGALAVEEPDVEEPIVEEAAGWAPSEDPPSSVVETG